MAIGITGTPLSVRMPSSAGAASASACAYRGAARQCGLRSLRDLTPSTVYTESWNGARPISTIAERMYLGVQRDERDGWSDAPRLRHGLTESRSRSERPSRLNRLSERRRDRPDTRGTETRSRTTGRASVNVIPPLIHRDCYNSQ